MVKRVKTTTKKPSTPRRGGVGAVRATSVAVDVVPPRQRSAITNNLAALPGCNGNSPWTRRFKDVIAAHVSDLGGIDHATAGELALVRRAATLVVELERYEIKFAANNGATPAQFELYIRGVGSLRRVVATLGLARRMRDVTPPTIDEYARRLESEAA